MRHTKWCKINTTIEGSCDCRKEKTMIEQDDNDKPKNILTNDSSCYRPDNVYTAFLKAIEKIEDKEALKEAILKEREKK